MPDFGPSNEQELEIAKEVDRMSLAGNLTQDSMLEIVEHLPFRPSVRDCEFLARYVSWRLAHPIEKLRSN